MVDLVPYLIIHSPSGQQNTLELRDISYSIGRLPDNDIALIEDPDSQITRIKHCILTRNKGQWFVSDHSTNGTKLPLNDSLYDVHENDIPLESGAVLHISQWRLSFHDPNATQKSRRSAKSQAPSHARVVPQGQFIYKLAEVTLYYQSRDQRQALPCRRKVTQMLTYMAEQNLKNQGQPILCQYQDLMEAIWGLEEGHNPLEINGLAGEIRKLFATHSPQSDPHHFLKTVRGLGYILNITCEW